MDDPAILMPLLILLITVQLGDYAAFRGHQLRAAASRCQIRAVAAVVAVTVLSAATLAFLAGGLPISLPGWMLALAIIHAIHTCLRLPLYECSGLRSTTLGRLAGGYILYIIYLTAFTLLAGSDLGTLIAGTLARGDAALPIALSSWLPAALAVVAGYLFVGRGGAEIVRATLDTLNLPSASEPDQLSIGLIIGYLERYLLLTFILLGQYGAIGFVLAAKSIARYTGISESKAFAEYYLVGTLTSATVAIAVGLAARGLIAALLPA